MQSKQAYWRGDGSDLGNVSRLPQQTFSALVEEVLGASIVLNVTRDKYHSLPKAKQQKAKRVPYLVPCIFKDDDSKRRLEYVTGISLLCLDVDVSKYARPYYNDPDTLAEQLAPFNHAIYSTASSTDEKPRVRIFIDAQNIPVKRYRDAIKTIAKLIGLPELNAESITVNLPMFLPTVFKGEEDTHPLIGSYVDGRAFGKKDIKTSSIAEEEFDSHDIDEDEDSDEVADIDDLDYLRTRVDNISIKDIKGALHHMDPDCSYSEWLSTAAALRHQFPKQSNQAYELFDEWSSTGERYEGEKDTRAKWRSLKPNPRGRNPITIRTLMMRATQSGWDNSTVKARCFDDAMKWVRKVKLSASAFMVKSILKIASVPLLTISEEEILLGEVAIRCKKDHSIKPTISSLRKDLSKARVMETMTKKKKEKMPKWAKGMCYVSSTNKFLKPTTQATFSPESLDRVYGEELLPSDKELSEGGDSTLSAKCKPVVRPQDYLLNYIKIPRAYDIVYDPQQLNDTYVHHEGKTYVNTYIRNYPEPDEDSMEEAAEIFMNHMDNLIAEDEYRIILLDFMAYIVQHPGYKIRWAVLLQGVDGCGKTFLSEAMHAVLGKGHVTIVDLESLKGSWNDWAYGSQLVSLEEIRVAGHNRHEVMNQLKPLITNDSICINQRFNDTKTLNNKTNYLLFTNHHDALVLTEGDRRYFVLKSKIQTKKQVGELGEGYFKTLFEMLRDNAGGLRAFFEEHTISKDFSPHGHAPVTTYLKQIIFDTTSDAGHAVKEIIEDSKHALISEDFLSTRVLMVMLELNECVQVKPQQLASILRDLGYVNKGRHLLDDDRHYLWAKPDTDGFKDPKLEANYRLETHLEDDSNKLL